MEFAHSRGKNEISLRIQDAPSAIWMVAHAPPFAKAGNFVHASSRYNTRVTGTEHCNSCYAEGVICHLSHIFPRFAGATMNATASAVSDRFGYSSKDFAHESNGKTQ